MQKKRSSSPSHRPRALTVFAAAFVAGAAAAVGINRALDIHLAQAKPQVECEPIFVALRGMPQGTPVTIWDVALRDWPKAMLPTTALRAGDRFEGMILKHPVREGQPLLSVQLVQAQAQEAVEQVAESYVPAVIQPAPAAVPDADLWAPPSNAVAVNVVTPQVVAPPEAVAAQPPQADQPTERETTAVVETATEPAATDIPTEPVPPQNAAPADVASETIEPLDAAPTAAVPTADDVATVADLPQEETAASPASPPVKRFLVIPERIAVQAELSFTTPATQQSAVVETPPAAPASAAPATAQAAPQQRPAATTARTPAAQQRQSPGKARQPGSSPAKRTTAVPRVAQAPTLETHPNTEPVQPANAWGPMFPNLRAGFDALKKK